MLDRLRSTSLMLCMIVLLGGLAFWLFSLTEGGKDFLGDNFGKGNLPVIDFGSLETGSVKEGYLLCPASYCMQSDGDEPPVWAASASDLMNAVIQFMDNQEDIRTVRIDIPSRQFDFTVPVAGRPWPDLLTIRFISLSENLSTIAVFARTEIGTATTQADQQAMVANLLDSSTTHLPKAALEEQTGED